MSRILIVDDEPSISWGLAKLARGMGHEALVASSAEEGLRLAAAARPDLLILDVRLPGMDGISAMEAFGAALRGAPIIIITAFGDLETAVGAIRKGAFEYVIKPFDLATIRATIERALRMDSTAVAVTPVEKLDGMLGQSPAMQAVFKKLALAAHSDASVLLQGESGVGKEVAATAIHRNSARKDAPLVAVNVAALSPTLAEAELFGHVEGAFTGAVQARPGLLLQANEGTLFLDEVADMPLPLQQKLLRVLDHGEVLPVGADTPLRTSFRVISATHQNLRERVEVGEFRHDLFFRLCTFEIEIPPLRERPEDITLLAHHFAGRFANGPINLPEETLAELQKRLWFGNVRELRNAIEHALIMARRGAVMPEHLPPALPNLASTTRERSAEGVGDVERALAQVARQLVSDPELAGDVYNQFLKQVEPPLLATVMSSCGQQCAPAARVLGLHRTTLKKKLDQYEIQGVDADK